MTKLASGLVAALLACTSGTALAQSSAAPVTDSSNVPAAESNDNDVVVTAQKREQRIKDVPITVTAVTGTRMADLGINSLSEVALFVPGLRIQSRAPTTPAS